MYILAAILLLAAIAYLVFSRPSKPDPDAYFVATQSQSNERVKNLNLHRASEDASYILDAGKLSFPDVAVKPGKAEYKADPEREWILNLIPVQGDVFRKEDFTKMFDYPWRSNYPSNIYGFSEEENRWTYADAGGTPDVYSKIQVAIDVQGVFNEKTPDYNPQKLQRYVGELEKRLKKYPSPVKVEPAETVESAIAKAQKLIRLHQEFNRDAIIVLHGDTPFKGLEMWDALQSLGLTWGDGDLFHWDNAKDYGHDQHFSVWTTTEPGYFLPEEIQAGHMNPQDLVFGFSIPRSADPQHTLDIMLQAVKYCQKRLGGQILNANMQPFQEDPERMNLFELLGRMESKGLKPGSAKALRMF